MNEGSESGLGNAQLNELLQGIPEAGGAARGGGGYIHPLPVSQVLAIWDIKRWFPAMVWSVRYKVVQKSYEFELAESDSTKEDAPSGAKQSVGNGGRAAAGCTRRWGGCTVSDMWRPLSQYSSAVGGSVLRYSSFVGSSQG